MRIPSLNGTISVYLLRTRRLKYVLYATYSLNYAAILFISSPVRYTYTKFKETSMNRCYPWKGLHTPKLGECRDSREHEFRNYQNAGSLNNSGYLSSFASTSIEVSQIIQDRLPIWVYLSFPCSQVRRITWDSGMASGYASLKPSSALALNPPPMLWLFLFLSPAAVGSKSTKRIEISEECTSVSFVLWFQVRNRRWQVPVKNLSGGAQADNRCCIRGCQSRVAHNSICPWRLSSSSCAMQAGDTLTFGAQTLVVLYHERDIVLCMTTASTDDNEFRTVGIVCYATSRWLYDLHTRST